MLPRLERFGHYIVTGDTDLAGCGWHEPGDDLHGGGLACAVGSQKSKYLARFDSEGYVGYRRKSSVHLGDVFNFDHLLVPFITQQVKAGRILSTCSTSGAFAEIRHCLSIDGPSPFRVVSCVNRTIRIGGPAPILQFTPRSRKLNGF